MTYTTWEYYSVHYDAITDEAEFGRLNDLAARKIDIFTGRRASTVTGYKAEALKDCVCNLIEYLKATEAQGQGIQSVSNDGYSENYQAVTPRQLDENLRSVAFCWLSGTGLMGAL